MEDQYYQTLPFTLSEDQLDYDFLIFGTNLQACLLSAHLAKIQKKRGLVLEFEKGYGGDIKTLSLKQLHEFMTNKGMSCQTHAPLPFQSVLSETMMEANIQTINKKKQTTKSLRGYNIDLQPRVFSGASFACEMLKDGNMNEYMDFRVIKKVLFLLNGKLEEVPLNLKTIMNAQGLSLFERKDLFKGVHQLVKIYYKFHSVEVDNNSTNQFDKDTDVNKELFDLFCQEKDKLCHKFLLKAMNNKQKLFDMVMYGICGYQYKKPPQFVQGQYTSLEMLKRFGRFVKSCGVYSNTPYLYVDNGIGDIPQAFSRIASIFGSIFIIHPRVEINQIQNKGSEGYQVSSNLAPDQKIKVKTIQYTEPYFNYLSPKLQTKQEPHYQRVLRVIVINKAPSDFKHEGPLIIHSFQNPLFVNPVTCFLFDSHSSNCPEDQYVLQFMTIVQSNNQQDVQNQVSALLKLGETIFGEQQTEYVAAYIQTNTYFNQHGEHIIQNDWNFDVERVFEQFKEAIGEQTKYFKDESLPGQSHGDEDDGYYEGLLSRLDNLKEKKEQKQKEQQQQTQKREETNNAGQGEENKNVQSQEPSKPEVVAQKSQTTVQQNKVSQPQVQSEPAQNNVTQQSPAETVNKPQAEPQN